MISTAQNPVVEQYSRLADKYDDEANVASCWGRLTDKTLRALTLKDSYGVVADIGCGTGNALFQFASAASPNVQFVGVEPAQNMRKRASLLTGHFPNVRILDGRFEELPLETQSVDYLYSILAFHWTTEVERSVREVSRVLKRDGESDLIFIGRNNGREFITKTTPLFLKYMGPALLLESAVLRKQLSRDEAFRVFDRGFAGREAQVLEVEESFETYYDTLEKHWSWWVRIEGHFVKMPPERKSQCDEEVRKAISTLQTENGIPYTVHLLHVKLRRKAFP